MYVRFLDQPGVIVYFDAVRELDRQKYWVLDLMANVRCSYVVVKPLGVVSNNNLALALALILALNELLLNVVVAERLNERAELFLLVVTRRPT